MVERISNSAYLEVAAGAPTENTGWTARVLSERDYSTVIAEVHRFSALSITSEANAEGGGTITVDADDPLFTTALPAGETTRLKDQEAIWQVLEDGQVRGEFFAEDVDDDVQTDPAGPRSVKIAGRGIGKVLEWAVVMPRYGRTDRVFETHPMKAWVQLFNEAKADGYLDWVTLTFDDTGDTEGVPWGPVQKFTVSAGQNLLDLLTQWCEANELAWRMLPGFRLQVFKNPGHRLEGKVVFTAYRSQGEHKRKTTRREIANTIFVSSGIADDPDTKEDESKDTPDDPDTPQDESRDVIPWGVAKAVDSDSQAKWRKRAVWISAGSSIDEAARSQIANSNLALTRDQKLSRTLKIITDKDGRQPFVDFTVHDWITVEVPDDDTESGVRKVVALTVAVDVTGVAVTEAVMQSKFDVRAVKIQKLLDRLGAPASRGGGVGAAGASPVPISKAISAIKLADLSDLDVDGRQAGAVIQWNGSRWVDATPNLDLLTDVDVTGIPPSGDVALVYNRGTGRWQPGGVEASSIPEATSAMVGGVRLAGDLGGTAQDPTVPGLAGKADKGHGHTITDLPVATGGQSSAEKVVRADDPRLSDPRTPKGHNHPIAGVDGLGDALAGKVATTTVGAPGGVAALDDAGHVPVTQLPPGYGGEVRVGDLVDVDLTVPPAAGQVLAFDPATTTWAPVDLPAGGDGTGAPVAGGMVFHGPWQAGVTYRAGSVVTRAETHWLARADTQAMPATGDTVFAHDFADGTIDSAVWAIPARSGPGPSTTTDLTSAGLGTPPVGAVRALTLGAAHSGTTTVATTVEFTTDGTVSFWEAASTEPVFDRGRFTIDGVQHGPAAAGTTGWVRRTYQVTAGVHTLAWSYTKDGSVSQGRDTYLVTLIDTTGTAPHGDWAPLAATTGGGATGTLAGLGDVDVAGAVTGQALVYQGGVWQAGDVAAGAPGHDIEGGGPDSVFLPDQVVDGGTP